MKKIGFVSGVFAALLVAPLLAFAQTQQAGSPVALSDGAMAKVYDHCGEGDLCATIDYPNGDRPAVRHSCRTNEREGHGIRVLARRRPAASRTAHDRPRQGAPRHRLYQ